MKSVDRPALPRVLVAAALSCALFVAPALITATAAAAATATPTPSASAEPAIVTATVGTGGIGVLQPNQDLQVSVSVHNGTTESITGANLTVSLDSDTLDDRAALSEWQNGTTDAVGSIVAQNGDLRLLPATTAQLTVTVAAAAIPFAADTDAGTHALEVRVSTSGGDTLATARNSIEWLPGAPTGTTGVSITVPLVVPNSVDALIPAETLADYTAVTGTLTRQLDAIWGRPVAIGIDPRILASIRILGSSAPESAMQWLTRLEAAPNETFALQYADADIASQAQSGAATLLAAPESFDFGVQDSLFAAASPTPTATDTATAEPTPTAGTESTPTPSPTTDPNAPEERPTAESLLAFDYSYTGIGWAPADTLRSADLGVYSSSGIFYSIVSSDNLTLPTGASAVTAAAVENTSLAVSDSSLTDAFDTAVTATTDADWRAAMTTLTAEMAQIQRGGDVPGVLIAASRSAAVDGYRLSQTLDALSTLPWAAPADLGAALGAPRTADVGVTDNSESDDRIGTAAQLAAAEVQVQSFATVLDEPALLIGRQRGEHLAVLAVSWLDDATGWAEAAQTELDGMRTTMDSVRIESASDLLQLSRDSSIPVYVRNDLPWPVTVDIQTRTSRAVLDIDENSIDPVSIEAKSQARTAIPVKARVGNGEAILTLQLHSTTGVPIDGPATLRASVRADWETVGTLILGIALVLFFGYGVIRSIRKRRRGGDPDDDEPDPNSVLEVQPGQDEPRG
ncbi:hypothetical protein HQQ81_17180 [Microbacteriaceae bacterium VKM Ac-2854]|nr:hypothetical protein [Microbacteriaceae bacterium VKM Ac-2854]